MAEAPTVDNKVAVLILQHPQEQDRVLGTAKLICATLEHAKLTIGLSWRNLGHALGEPVEAKDWGVLYLGSAHAMKEKGALVALDRKGEPLADQMAARAGRRWCGAGGAADAVPRTAGQGPRRRRPGQQAGLQAPPPIV